MLLKFKPLTSTGVILKLLEYAARLAFRVIASNNFIFRKCDMTTITIDNKEYVYEDLSANAKAQLSSIQFVDAELARLQSNASVLQTARMAYSKALEAELNPLGTGDTIQF